VNTIFLIASFNAFFFAVLLLQKKPLARHDIILFLWLLYLGIYTGVYGLTSNYLFHKYPLLSASFISLLMLHGPFLYLYVTSLTTGAKGILYENVYHFIPFVLFNTYIILAALLQKANGISLEHTHTYTHPPFIFVFFLIITALSGPVYFVLSAGLFKKLGINISNNFSSLASIDPAWLKKLTFIFGIIWTLLITVAVIHHVFNLFSLSFCTDGLALALSVFIILLGYFGLRQKEIFFNLPLGKEEFVTQPSKKYMGTGLKQAEASLIAERLLQYISTEKPYLDPEITLPQMAESLKVASHHLSQVINEELGMNFFDLINSYRVEEVKKRINDPAFANYSLLGIAFECGFNSKSAFNRLFKKFTGTTPSAMKSV
jgi:AraC-like DNA-binding protein